MTDIDFVNIPVNNEEKLYKIKRAFKYLNKLKIPSVIVDDRKSFETFYYLRTVFSDDKFLETNTDWTLFERTKFDQLIVKLLYYLEEICDDFKIDEYLGVSRKEINLEASLNERKITILDHLVVITNRLVDLQFKNDILFNFSKRLFENKIINALIKFMDHEQFLSKYSEDYAPHDQIVANVATIRNFSENPYLNKQIWINLNIEKILKDFSSKTNNPNLYNQLTDEICSNIKQKSLEEFLIFISSFKSQIKIYESEEIYNDLFYIKFLVKIQIFKEFELFKRYDFVTIIEKLINHFNSIRSKLNNVKFIIHTEEVIKNADLNDRKLTIFYNLLIILNECIFRSIDMNLYFGRMSLVKALMEFLDNDFLKKINKNKKLILVLIIKNLSTLSRWSDDVKKEWTNLGIITKLLNFINTFNKSNKEDKSELNELIISAYYCIGNIAEDEQIEKLPEINFVVYQLLEEIVKFSDCFASNQPVQKVFLQLMNDDNKIETFEVSYLDRTLTGTLYGLTRFSVNSKMAKIIFEKFASLKTIIYKGNQIEQVWSLKLLAQLCFFEEIIQQILNDTVLCHFIEDLNFNSKNKDLKNVTQTLLWFFNHNIIDVNKNKEYVVLIYNASTKYICLKIKDELQKNGIDVWLDFENLNGYNIDTVALAIQKCKCVIFGVCEKLRLNEQNQVQIQYAVKLNKPMIGLIMQDGYENVSGWLGNVIKDKVKINFITENFNDCITKLVDNINNCVNISPLTSDDNVNGLFDPEKWTWDQIHKWFVNNKIHQSIIKLYDSIDGFTLKQIHNMKTQTPEFFYQTFNQELKHSAKTSDIAYFSGKLDSLFGFQKL